MKCLIKQIYTFFCPRSRSQKHVKRARASLVARTVYKCLSWFAVPMMSHSRSHELLDLCKLACVGARRDPEMEVEQQQHGSLQGQVLPCRNQAEQMSTDAGERRVRGQAFVSCLANGSTASVALDLRLTSLRCTSGKTLRNSCTLRGMSSSNCHTASRRKR